MDSRLGTGSVEASLKGFGLVEGDDVLPHSFCGREREVVVNQRNIDSESFGVLDSRLVAC
jgi:hypothetical protein